MVSSNTDHNDSSNNDGDSDSNTGNATPHLGPAPRMGVCVCMYMCKWVGVSMYVECEYVCVGECEYVYV